MAARITYRSHIPVGSLAVGNLHTPPMGPTSPLMGVVCTLYLDVPKHGLLSSAFPTCSSLSALPFNIRRRRRRGVDL